MALLNKIPVTWTGGPGMPGVSIFYSDNSTASPLGALVTFFTALKGVVPGTVSWTIPNSGDVVDSQLGTIVSSWTGSGGGTVAATGVSSSYAGGAGAVIRWNSAGIVAGRRVKGRTFIVPLIGTAYDAGSIHPTQLGILQTAASALVTSAGADLRVWSRPQPGRVGSAFAITSAVVPDLAAVLRSRRD